MGNLHYFVHAQECKRTYPHSYTFFSNTDPKSKHEQKSGLIFSHHSQDVLKGVLR